MSVRETGGISTVAAVRSSVPTGAFSQAFRIVLENADSAVSLFSFFSSCCDREQMAKVSFPCPAGVSPRRHHLGVVTIAIASLPSCPSPT